MSSSAAEPMIRAVGLRKSFVSKQGTVEAVKGIDVEVRRGESFGFLGPNGAGKSSTMRMVAAVSPVSGGTLRILGLDPATDGPEIRARIGVCPQEDTLDTELNVSDNLYVYGRYFGIPRAEVRQRVEELLEFVQLTEKAKSKVEDLSGGMKRRLTIARSLINRPEVLLLDEPTTGLDPQARHVVWDRLFRLKQQGVTIVLTTHYMDEAEQLCDRLVVMDKGLIVAEGSPLELIRAWSTREVAELRFGVGEHEALAAKVEDLAERVEVLPDRLLLYTSDGEETLAKVHERGLAPGRLARTPLHARGRLPPAHRTHAGRLMSTTDTTRPRHGADRAAEPAGRRPPDGRLLGHGLPPHVEGQRDHVLRDAAALHRRDGRAARRLHRGRPRPARGRHHLPGVRGAGDARRPGDDGRVRRGHLPRDGDDQVAAHLLRR